MTTPSISKIREGQMLSLGRELEAFLVKRLDVNGAPYQTGDDGEGVSLEDGLDSKPILMIAGVRLSKKPRHSDGSYYITTLDEATTYRVTLNGSNYDVTPDPGDTIEDVIDALVAAIGSNEAGTPSTKVEPQKVYEYDENNDVSAVRLDLLGGIDSTWTGAGTVTGGGSGAVTYERDATTVSYRLWVEWSWGWGIVPGEAFEDLTLSQFDRYVVSGAKRGYLEITATDGRVYEVYGVGVLEEET